MKGQTNVFVLVFAVLVIAAVCVFVIVNYNGLVSAEKAYEEARSQIGVVCQRRLDLIPNLIETVKAYAQHEQLTLVAVTEARARAQKALAGIGGEGPADIQEVAAAQAAVGRAVKGLFALVEQYPALRAANNFLALQDQFEGTENRIAVARQRYNHAVKVYNERIDKFPGVFIAPLFGFAEQAFYEVEDERAYQPVKAEL